MEEDITKHAEFPEEGKFNLPALHGNRYKICGDLEDAQTSEESLPTTPSVLSPYVQSTSLPGPSTRNWSIPQLWMSSGTIARKPFSSTTNPLLGKRPVNQAYETFLKKSIPFVTLSLEGKNITIDSTNDNVYIRIPESAVSVLSILSEIGPKLSLQQDDLVLLDAKFIPVSDDKG